MTDDNEKEDLESSMTLTESRLVWLLVKEVIRRPDYMSDRPRVGDLVVEVSHIVGGTKNQLGDTRAVGRVTEIRQDANGTFTVIDLLDDKNRQSWENCKFAILEEA